VEGKIWYGSPARTVTKVQGRVLGGGQLVVTVSQSLGLSFDAPILFLLFRW
jgi:hypothetical protein